MLVGLLMIIAPCLVFVLTLPLSRFLRPKLRKVYRISGGLIVFLGGAFSFYLASYTGDQGGIAAYFFQKTVILIYTAMSFAVVIANWSFHARESGDIES